MSILRLVGKLFISQRRQTAGFLAVLTLVSSIAFSFITLLNNKSLVFNGTVTDERYFVLFGSVTVLCCLLGSFYLFQLALNMNRKHLSVIMLAGATDRQLKQLVVTEVTVLYVASSVLAILISALSYPVFFRFLTGMIKAQWEINPVDAHAILISLMITSASLVLTIIKGISEFETKPADYLNIKEPFSGVLRKKGKPLLLLMALLVLIGGALLCRFLAEENNFWKYLLAVVPVICSTVYLTGHIFTVISPKCVEDHLSLPLATYQMRKSRFPIMVFSFAIEVYVYSINSLSPFNKEIYSVFHILNVAAMVLTLSERQLIDQSDKSRQLAQMLYLGLTESQIYKACNCEMILYYAGLLLTFLLPLFLGGASLLVVLCSGLIISIGFVFCLYSYRHTVRERVGKIRNE